MNNSPQQTKPSQTNPPLKKNNNPGHLSFSPFTLGRHPSAKNLDINIDTNNNSKSDETTGSNNSGSQTHSDNSPKVVQSNFKIKVDEAETELNPLNNQIFYVHNEDVNLSAPNSNIYHKSPTSQKNLNFYGFTEDEKKFDQFITQKMQREGRNFFDIQQHFLLKVDDDKIHQTDSNKHDVNIKK